MAPKRARKTPVKKTARKAAAERVASTVTPDTTTASLASSSSSTTTPSSASLPTSPHSPPHLANTRPPSFVSLEAHKPARPSHHAATAATATKSEGPAKPSNHTAAASPSSRSWSWIVMLVAVVVAGLGFVVVNGTESFLGSGRGAWGSQGGHHHPCACATAAASTNLLAKAALSRRSGVSGLHWQRHNSAGGTEEEDPFAFVSRCKDMSVHHLRGPFTSADQLRSAMLQPFAQRSHRCVVWITTPASIQAVANALKELLENNKLGGATVVPPQARGVLVVESSLAREELKDLLPHRVVHMLSSVN